MNTCNIVDCTLRDGGYYTDWDFEQSIIDAYINAVEVLPIDVIEIGYRGNTKTTSGYLGKFYYLSESLLRQFCERIPNKKIAVMLNSKEISESDVSDLIGSVEDFIDVVRLAIDPDNVMEAIPLLKALRICKVEVAVNFMYASIEKKRQRVLTTIPYIDEYVDIINIVDSYGGMLPDEVETFVSDVRKIFTKDLGFHGHNNIDLAFANSLSAINAGANSIDSTLLGIGRGAGNLKTELLLAHLHRSNNTDQIRSVGSVLEQFEMLKSKYNWGTNLAYIYTGLLSLPQKDVMDLITKNRYTLSSIVSSMNTEFSDFENVDYKWVTNRKSLLIGGGKSVVEHCDAIQLFLEKNPDIRVVFNSSRYSNLFDKCKNLKYLILAGDEIIRPLYPVSDNIDQVFVSSTLNLNFDDIDFSDKVYVLAAGSHKNIDDSPLNIALEVCKNENNEIVYFCGFDGYDSFNNQKEFMLAQETQAVISGFKDAELISITKTSYHDIVQGSVYAMV